MKLFIEMETIKAKSDADHELIDNCDSTVKTYSQSSLLVYDKKCRLGAFNVREVRQRRDLHF